MDLTTGFTLKSEDFQNADFSKAASFKSKNAFHPPSLALWFFFFSPHNTHQYLANAHAPTGSTYDIIPFFEFTLLSTSRIPLLLS